MKNTKLIEDIKKDSYNLVMDRIIAKFVEIDRSNDIYDLSIKRLNEHREASKEMYDNMTYDEKRSILNSIYKDIMKHRNENKLKNNEKNSK